MKVLVVLEKMRATGSQKAFAHIPVCTVDELAPARFQGRHVATIAAKLSR